jgi:hypothetical protein
MFRTRSPPCAAASSPPSSKRCRDAHAAQRPSPDDHDTETCDVVRLEGRIVMLKSLARTFLAGAARAGIHCVDCCSGKLPRFSDRTGIAALRPAHRACLWPMPPQSFRRRTTDSFRPGLRSERPPFARQVPPPQSVSARTGLRSRIRLWSGNDGPPRPRNVRPGNDGRLRGHDGRIPPLVNSNWSWRGLYRR